MKSTREQFFEEHGPSTIFIVWIIWTIIAGVVLSTVNLGRYGDQDSRSFDCFDEGYTGIITPVSENQTIENLTQPTLFNDNTTMSVHLPPGEYHWTHVTDGGQLHWITVTNDTGKILVDTGSRSSGGGFGTGGGGLIVTHESWHLFEFEGAHIIQFDTSTIIQIQPSGSSFFGKTHSRISSYRFMNIDHVPDNDYQSSHIEHRIFRVNVNHSLYNIIIYDAYYNTMVNRTGLEGHTTFEYNDMYSYNTYVVIETESESAEIDISIGRKEVASKADDYITIGALLGVTSIIVVATGLVLFWKKGSILENEL